MSRSVRRKAYWTNNMDLYRDRDNFMASSLGFYRKFDSSPS